MAGTITPAMAGCWFAGASSRSADELNHAVVMAARDWGMVLPAWAEDLNRPDRWEGVWLVDSDGEDCAELAQQARDYFNGIAPEGYSFDWDDGFYMLSDCSWEWFEPEHETCAHCAPEGGDSVATQA